MQTRSFFWFAGVVVSVAACGAGAPRGFSDPTPDSGTGAPGDAGSGTIVTDDAGPVTPSISCSDDLHSVVDERGNVVKACPADQGCAPGGTCVPACASANANRSTLGCDYFTYSPDIIPEGKGACYATIIANTWSSPVKVTVDRDGQQLDVSKFARVPSGNGQALTYAPLKNGAVQPGETAILFLSHWSDPNNPLNDIPCPVPAAVEGDIAVRGTGVGKAFHVATDAPVVAYDIFPFGGGAAAATSASLLLPTSSWDVNYLGINAFAPSQIAAGAGAQPTLDIIAQEDGTLVTIKPTAPVTGGGGVAAAPQGQSKVYTLSKGDVLQLEQPLELSGTPIQANKPIAVFGGASGLNIDPGTCCADSAHQQIPPVSALGSEYVGVKYRNRDDAKDETVPWRVMGLVGGTKLTYAPSAPPGAPTTLASGEVVEFQTDKAFVVRSQDDKHPFYMSGHMTGCMSLFPPGDCRGDAEFVNVVPAKQFLRSYVFFTDPTYPETNLVVVRAQGGAPVELDCYGALGGWQTVGAWEYTRVDLVRHDFQKQGKCDNGRHEMHSTSPFGVTVWGWGSAETKGAYHIPQAPGFYSQAVSYAYPAGMSVRPINTIVVPAGPN